MSADDPVAPEPVAGEPVSDPAPSESPKSGRGKGHRAELVSAIAILAVYLAAVVGYFWLDSSAAVVEWSGHGNTTETAVVLDLTGLRPVDNAVEANVLVLPDPSLLDQFGALTTDLTVQLHPSNDFSELSYTRGHTPGREKVSMFVFGDADRWPFDRFQTGTISADVYVGSGDSRRYVPSRVDIAGSLNGWDISNERHPSARSDRYSGDDATITFKRSRGPLALIAGLCLVLLTLPAIAMYVAIEILLGRKAFQPAFGTFFAAMLFSVVPIRGVLPGNPPAGSWIDEAITVWVLIALTAATVLYIAAWARRAD